MMAAMPLNAAHGLHSLLKGLAETLPEKDMAIEGLCLDSRQCRPGDLFMACAGEQSHGLLHAADAVARGASAIAYENANSLQQWPETGAALEVVREKIPCVPVHDLYQKVGLVADRFYAHPSSGQFIVGITGTNGKTSCSQFIAEAISTKEPCGVIGTLGNGLYGELTPTRHTTPDALAVHGLLSGMKQQGASCVVMEVSSHGLVQGRVNGVAFDLAVFTNLTHEHLDYHEDMESYASAKRKLFDMPGLRYAVINIDDEYGRRLFMDLPPSVRKVGYSLATKDGYTERLCNDSAGNVIGCVVAEQVELTLEGLRVKVNTPWGTGEFRSHLLGRFNASNLLAVLSVLLIKGLGLDEALDLMAGLHTVPGRMQHFGGEHGRPLVVVDYAHTPDALGEVLTALREHCRGDLWCVFGCGGDRDRAKRPLMASIAEELADHIVITDDNPRTESPRAITDDIIAGLAKPAGARLEHDRARAIHLALDAAGGSDIVLVAGKGHEDYQIVGNERLPFSDSGVIETWLSGGAA